MKAQFLQFHAKQNGFKKLRGKQKKKIHPRFFHDSYRYISLIGCFMEIQDFKIKSKLKQIKLEESQSTFFIDLRIQQCLSFTIVLVIAVWFHKFELIIILDLKLKFWCYCSEMFVLKYQKCSEMFVQKYFQHV